MAEWEDLNQRLNGRSGDKLARDVGQNCIKANRIPVFMKPIPYQDLLPCCG
jgi:hypothetical protein